MTGRLAIDFGTSNTVLAIWNPVTKSAETLLLKPFSSLVKQDNEQIPLIPSIINFAKDSKVLVGDEVLQSQLEDNAQTFSSLKSDILKDLKHRLAVNNKNLTSKHVASDLISAILRAAINHLKLDLNEPIAVTTPVEAFEHYSDWLATTFASQNLKIRTFDEPTAAAVSIGQKIQNDDIWMLFDFGAGTLDLSIVKYKEDHSSPTGMRHLVVAKESVEVAGDLIDQWIAQHFIQELSLSADDDLIKNNKRLLLRNCRAAKEALTFKTEANILLLDVATNKTHSVKVTRDQFHAILTQNGLFKTINDLIADSKYKMRNRGFDPDSIKGIFMVGGSSFIPAVKAKLEENFYKPGQVILHRPLDAIARGAAALIAGAKLIDHVQHSYFLQYLDPDSEKTTDQLIVQAGSSYPSKEPIGKLTFYAKAFNQTEFKMFFYEQSHRPDAEADKKFILKDKNTSESNTCKTQHFERKCVNPDKPIILRSKTTYQKDEPALDIEFGIDENKHLTISTYKYNEFGKPIPVDLLIKAIKLK